MRLRYLLPMVEMAASIVFVFIPLWLYLPDYRPRGPDGVEIECHDNCPPLPRFIGIDPVTFGRGVSLPSVPIVLLICSAKWDYSHDGHDYFHDPVWRGVGFVLIGAGVWFLLGGFLDEVIVWRRSRIPPSFRFSNLIFGLTVALLATMSVVGIFDGYTLRSPGFAWLVFWDMVWILIGYSCVAVGILQLIQTKKKSARVSAPTSRLS